MKIELLLRKLSDFYSLSIQECGNSGNSILLLGQNIRIRFERETLHFETKDGKFEIPAAEIEDFNFFSKTKHCKIKLRNAVMRIYPESDKHFKFFFRID